MVKPFEEWINSVEPAEACRTSTSYSYTLSNETFKRKDKKSKPKGDDQADDSQLNESMNRDINNMQNKDNKSNESGAEVKTDAEGYEKVEMVRSSSFNYFIGFGNSSEFNYEKLEYKQKSTMWG